MLQQKALMRDEERHQKIQTLKKCHHDLQILGFTLRHIKSLKPKHIDRLVTHWQAQTLSVGRMKNLLAHLRFVAGAVGKTNIIQKNAAYGIGSRSSVATHNKAIFDPDFSKIQDKHLYLSLQLQRVFGLRREECLKIKPHIADLGHYLKLQGSWTKGGIGRIIPIRTQEQRYCLEKAKAYVQKDASMIPSEKKYRQQRNIYDALTRLAGLRNLHGLRHAYAQTRYRELTGWEAPINGGKLRREMSSEEKQRDTYARKVVSGELGHARIAIVKNYCA